MPGPGLAQLVRRPKGRAYPAAQPIRVDAQRLTENLERERAVAVAALDPGEVASERTGAPVARGEQAPQAVLEDREPEQELTGQRPAAEADGHAAPPRLVGRLTATASQLADAWRAYRSDVSPVDGPIHGFPSGYTDRDRRRLRATFEKDGGERGREQRARDQREDVEDAQMQQLFRLAAQPDRHEGQSPRRRADQGPCPPAPEGGGAADRDDQHRPGHQRPRKRIGRAHV